MKTSESFIRVMGFVGFIFVIAIIRSFFHKLNEKRLSLLIHLQVSIVNETLL